MQLSSFTEKQLVQSYLKGNESAIEELIKRHKSAVFTYIICKVRNEALAEDIFQDTFIKVINTIKRKKYNDEGKFLPWVMRIAHNLIVDHYRKSNRMNTTTGGENFDIFDVITFFSFIGLLVYLITSLGIKYEDFTFFNNFFNNFCHFSNR